MNKVANYVKKEIIMTQIMNNANLVNQELIQIQKEVWNAKYVIKDTIKMKMAHQFVKNALFSIIQLL